MAMIATDLLVKCDNKPINTLGGHGSNCKQLVACKSVWLWRACWHGLCPLCSVSVESTRPMGKQLFVDPKKGRFAKGRGGSQGVQHKDPEPPCALHQVCNYGGPACSVPMQT